ncbi:hypothetical protein WMY93_008360 [Mugilogobius chulae]|uniref:Reverse transcriptase domain-containing protein n=1 Tax=Mugilogobius chulae TaxID=88201 RepID=A0AAW0PJ84_9GOBI
MQEFHSFWVEEDPSDIMEFNRVRSKFQRKMIRQLQNPDAALCPHFSASDLRLVNLVSRHIDGPEGVQFGDHRISSLLFADDVVLMASSNQDLQHVLERFAVECEAAGMKISSSKSEVMVLDQKKGGLSPTSVWGVLAPSGEVQVSQGLIHNEKRMEREIGVRWIGAVSAVMRSLYRTVVVKKELSGKAKLSTYWSIYIPPSSVVMNFGTARQSSLWHEGLRVSSTAPGSGPETRDQEYSEQDQLKESNNQRDHDVLLCADELECLCILCTNSVCKNSDCAADGQTLSVHFQFTPTSQRVAQPQSCELLLTSGSLPHQNSHHSTNSTVQYLELSNQQSCSHHMGVFLKRPLGITYLRVCLRFSCEWSKSLTVFSLTLKSRRLQTPVISKGRAAQSSVSLQRQRMITKTTSMTRASPPHVSERHTTNTALDRVSDKCFLITSAVGYITPSVHEGLRERVCERERREEEREKVMKRGREREAEGER